MLSGPIERARARAVADREAFAKRLTEVVVAKELAIEEGRSGDAATLRDHEREPRSQAGSTRWARLAAIAELRRRLRIPPRSQER